MHVDKARGYHQACGIHDRRRLSGRQEAHFRNAAARYGYIRPEPSGPGAIDDQPVLDQDIEHSTPPISILGPNVVCAEAEVPLISNIVRKLRLGQVGEIHFRRGGV
jgi:hypothetical protein